MDGGINECVNIQLVLLSTDHSPMNMKQSIPLGVKRDMGRREASLKSVPTTLSARSHNAAKRLNNAQQTSRQQRRICRPKWKSPDSCVALLVQVVVVHTTS